MIPVGFSSLPGWIGAVGVFCAVGAGVGATLRHLGHPSSTALAAIVAWPLLLPALVRQEPRGGPLAMRIARVFDSALAALDGGPALPGWRGEFLALRRALEQADGRLLQVDGILADSIDEGGDVERLQAARDRAVARCEDVLSAVGQLRVQVGLLALTELRDGATPAVLARLTELRARVDALEELSPGGTAA